jgi:3D (Asp-Asp-Asp) domain-containing protein
MSGPRALLGALGQISQASALLGLVAACTTAGSAWMAEPLTGFDEPMPLADERDARDFDASGLGGRGARPIGRRVIVLGQGEASENAEAGAVRFDDGPAIAIGGAPAIGEGRSLGTFRNTYYDFPNEKEFDGDRVALKGARCETIGRVPRGFYESVCVQGSGRLASGKTVSFSRRNCDCAEVCPRTGERICFDALDPKRFPFGRGASGRAITPLFSVAADADLLPLGTPVYVPEFRGLPRGIDEKNHDGCFLVEDRGLRVKGKQIDVFTGDPRVTVLYNRLLPSNRGVTVVVGSNLCARPERPQSAR